MNWLSDIIKNLDKYIGEIIGLAIFAIPMIWRVHAIWIAPLVAEIITLVFAIGLSKTTKLVYQ